MGKREDIVERAFEVFSADGFQMSGVAPLLAETGISKRTLYKYFRSKEDLIVEVIEQYQRKSFEEIPRELARRASTPVEQLLALFDLKAEPIERGDFRGCLALRAKLEFEGTNSEIEKACKKFTVALENFAFDLCRQAKCKKPKETSRQIIILLEGAIVLGQIHRDRSVFDSAKKAAQQLLAANVERH